MKKLIVLLALVATAPALAAMPEPKECRELAGRYSVKPDDLTYAELDTLEVCAAATKAEKLTSQRGGRVIRAYPPRRYQDAE